MIMNTVRKAKDWIGTQLCTRFNKHTYEIVGDFKMKHVRGDNVLVNMFDDYLQYCKYCKRLEKKSLLYSPPEIVDRTQVIDYVSLVGNLVPDPYNLEPEDLQLIKIIKPELYDYCKLYVNRGENK